MELYRFQVATADDVLEGNLCFKKQLTKDRAICFNNVVGLDQSSWARL